MIVKVTCQSRAWSSAYLQSLANAQSMTIYAFTKMHSQVLIRTRRVHSCDAGHAVNCAAILRRACRAPGFASRQALIQPAASRSATDDRR